MSHPLSLTGTTIAHYELVSLLGSGGMGDVFLARDIRLHRMAAIKLLRTTAEADRAAAERFLREARAVASLDHPNICTLYEVGSDQGRQFLAMQYIEGNTLAARLKQGALPFDEALRIGIELTGALVYAHSRQILHRDLKPQNVMLQKDGRVTLLDFGLAKVTVTGSDVSLAETNAALTQEGVVVGTLEYMSPEQMSGKPLDTRSDIYSLGLILYELLGGRHPYRGPTAAITMSGILTKPYPPLTGRHVPRAPLLNPVLKKTLSLRPDERYATAADLLVDLKRLERGTDGPDAGEPAARRWRPLQVAAAAIVLAGLAALLMPMANRARPVPASAPPVVPQFDRVFTYWFDVRGGDAAAASRSLGDEVLSGGSKVRVNVSSTDPGFLYMLDQEGDDERAIALVYPVATDQVAAADHGATGWYGFSSGADRDHLWLVWSADRVPQLEALRPLVNERDLGRVGDGAARALRVWLDEADGRDVQATRDAEPVQMKVSYRGPTVIRHILLHHTGRTSR